MIQRNKKIEEMYRDRENVHISYTQPVNPCHKKVAELVGRYSNENDTVLDIGCGIGHTLSEIKKRKPSLKLYASDIDDNTLAITKKNVPIEESYKINTVEDLFETDLMFDVIIMSHVLEHTHRPVDVVEGLVQMVNPNGIIILAVPNPVRLQVFLGNVIKKHYVNRGHVCAWDRSHWMNFLENIASLNVVTYSQDYFPLPLRSKLKFIVGPIELFLARIFPWLAFSNIAVIKVAANREDHTTTTQSS